MDKAELLSNFTAQLDKYDELRSFIDKAQAQSGKFSAATIEKVVMKNEIKSAEIADAIRPLVNDLEGVVADLGAEIDSVNEKKALRPIPGARPTGQFANSPINRQPIAAPIQVATKTAPESIPEAAMI